MYKFKTTMKEAALKNKTITSVANKLNRNGAYMICIMNGKRTCSKELAYFIAKELDNKLDTKEVDKVINKYFEREC